MARAHSLIPTEMKTGLFDSGMSVLAFSMLSIFLIACVNHVLPERFDCSTTDLTIELTAKSDPAGCNAQNGSIEVSAAGGIPPYRFRVGSGSFASTPFFSGLGAGSFAVIVNDSRGCEKQLENILLAVPDGPVAWVSTFAQTNCTDPDGSITVYVTGGSAPYVYQIGNGSFASASTFAGLRGGLYTITVMDAAACTLKITETIQRNTRVSYQTDIKPILEAHCINAGCHNGDNGGDRDWRIFANVQARAAGIKARTGNRSMPPDINSTGLPQFEIDLIACWVENGAQNN